MDELEKSKAEREARDSARSRISSSHTSEELAERAVKLYLITGDREQRRGNEGKDK